MKFSLLILFSLLLTTFQYKFCDGVLCSPTCSTCNLCNENNCKIAKNCKCASKKIPGNIPLSDTPQFIMLTFDDIPEYKTLYDLTQTIIPLQKDISIRDGLGCVVRPTLYAQSYTADFALAAYFEKLGVEIALHSVTHTTSMNTNAKTWNAEISTCYNDFLKLSSIKKISGFRAPFLETNDNMYAAMTQIPLLYDSSHPFYGLSWHKGESAEAQMNYWPHTLDYGFPEPGACYSGGCPKKAYPGIWEVYMNGFHKSDNSEYEVMDYDYVDVKTLLYDLTKDIKRNYEGNRAPLGLFFHSMFFLNAKEDAYDGNKLKMLQEVLGLIVKTFPKVVFATPSMIIEWVKKPIPFSQMKNQGIFKCPTPESYTFQNSCNDGKPLKLCPAKGSDTRAYYVCAKSCPNKYPGLNVNWKFT